MTLSALREENQQLGVAIEEALSGLRADPAWPADVRDLRWWVPDSARKHRRRLFVAGRPSAGAEIVAKIPLDPTDPMVARERDVLRDLAPTTVPRTALVRSLERGFVMTFLPGRDFSDVLDAADSPDTLRRLLSQAVDMMLPLHAADSAGPSNGTQVASAYVGEQLEQAGPAALDALTRTRTGPVHGDLGPWNIRWNPDREDLALIDWEDYQQVGIPAVDLLNTVLTSALLVFPEYRQRGFDWLNIQMLATDGPYRAAVRAALRRYARATGQSATDLARLLPVSCLWLHRRVEKQRRPTDHLFYLPLMRGFLAAEPRWIGALDD